MASGCFLTLRMRKAEGDQFGASWAEGSSAPWANCCRLSQQSHFLFLYIYIYTYIYIYLSISIYLPIYIYTYHFFVFLLLLFLGFSCFEAVAAGLCSQVNLNYLAGPVTLQSSETMAFIPKLGVCRPLFWGLWGAGGIFPKTGTAESQKDHASNCSGLNHQNKSPATRFKTITRQPPHGLGVVQKTTHRS